MLQHSFLSENRLINAIKKSSLGLLFSIIFLIGCSESKFTATKEDLTQYVNPYIGTDDHGHVFLGANVPFGAVQPGPTNYVRGWDWCSGYHYSDSIVTGFSQLHLSGTGIGDLGDVLITPFTGKIQFSPGTIQQPLNGYASLYTHDREKAEPGFYEVDLLTYGINVKITASERVSFHRYTFPFNEQSHIAINLELGIGWDKSINTKLIQLNDTTLAGFRHSSGWAKDQSLFFAIVLSKPIKHLALHVQDQQISKTEAEGQDVVGVLSFQTKENESIDLKVGISPVSYEAALKNIEHEIPHWDFGRVRAEAKDKWNRELSKIIIEDTDEAVKRTFYTAMYHSFIAPVLFNDHDRSYRGTDKKVYSDPGFENYSVFSLWDTYRANHPLFTIVQSERVNDMINSMLAIYQQQGKLPVWHLMGNETNCMVGYSAVPVVADAFFKGFKGFDANLAYESLIATSMNDEFGLNFLKEKGFIPADKEKESVSKALEYAIADWSIAKFADKMGDTEKAEYYEKRSKAYQLYFDPKTRFMRPLLNDGSFKSPFNPFKSVHEVGDYTEGNAWQYTWLVPHDVYGLIDLMGGHDAFEAKFDSFFVVSGDLGEKASPDISGLIGQYAQGNEPSHHAAYLYAFCGRQWKTAEKVRYIMKEFYSDQPDGLIGNEDCGQMSAWYLFSSLGFYPVNPASSIFVLGSPEVDKATIQLPDDKTFTIIAQNNNQDNIYIQSANLNGTPLNRTYLTYKEIMQGGILELEMGNIPNKEFGAKPENRPIEKLPY
ncbi:GH92 family glycosyl hydrolase [Thermophagus sp. OGC60D27]|uniref:GH92 family glycosyl hydrolase n=1 Tax=Thermophagus sp. OGC60D27 TaxID=3458415 RepID=UPI0040376E76